MMLYVHIHIQGITKYFCFSAGEYSQKLAVSSLWAS